MELQINFCDLNPLLERRLILKRYWLLLISILLTCSAFGQTSEVNCQKVGLKDKFGPVRSQGNMGWCFANAAADILSFHFREELQNKPVSAAYVALKFNYYFWAQNFTEGGFTYIALKDAMRNGLCPQTLEDDLMANGPKKTLREKLQYILSLKDMIDEGKVEDVKKAILESYKTKSILKRIPLYDLLTLLAISKRNQVLGNLADFICANNKHKIQRTAHAQFSTKYTFSSRTDLIDEINDNLNKSNPVGIGYFADFFDAENAPKTEASRHMSVVVDRQFNKEAKMCEFWVRNSWGTRCTGYKNPKMKARCKAGYILIPENILQDYIFSVSYLTD